MSTYFDTRETQDLATRERTLLDELASQLPQLRQHNAFYRSHLGETPLPQPLTRQNLSLLPLLRKSALPQLQAGQPPLAGIANEGQAIDRLFLSPGPIVEPERCDNDWWRMGRAFFAAGFRPGQRVQNCLSYHLSPGGFILDSGARACGCSVIPAGPGQTEQQLLINAQLQPEGYCGTPSFLAILLDKAAERGQTLSFRHALVTGEALTAAQRRTFADAGIRVHEAYATADLGLIAYETSPGEGLVVAEGILLELVRPGGSEPVAESEVGEVVITRLDATYPLIRFATGDLSSLLPGPSPCGRSNRRIRGWLGRADQSAKVRGLFIHPGQLEALRRSVPGLAQIRAVVSDQPQDHLVLLCEPEPDAPLGDAAALAQQAQAQLRLRCEIQWVAPETLPRDGILIEDRRPQH